jgi:hypothetical protein
MKKLDIKTTLGGSGLYSTDVSKLQLNATIGIDDFLRAYTSQVAGSLNLSKSESIILFNCIKSSRIHQGSGNIVVFDDLLIKGVIADYKKATGKVLSLKSIDNIMSKFVRDGIILKTLGLKSLNPQYFFRGNINKFTVVRVNLTAEFISEG